jgi:hypothetical protein
MYTTTSSIDFRVKIFYNKNIITTEKETKQKIKKAGK